MAVAEGTTPTFTLTFAQDSGVDLTQAAHVYVVFDGLKTIEKQDEDLTITERSVSVYLSQNETLSLANGAVGIQVNWTYDDGSRAASEIVQYTFSGNLMGRVLE